MSDEFEDFDDLEAQLRAAHSFKPRAGLPEEIRGRLAPARRSVPWAGFSAAAAVLLAVVGVGLLLHSVPRGGSSTAGTSGAGAQAQFGAVPAPREVATFGRLPVPTALRAQPAGAASAQASPPQSLPVYRYSFPGPSCAQDANGRLNGYAVIGGPPCWPSDAQSSYRLRPAPAGATLEYTGVADGSVVYYEPVYVLPDGSVEPALTPDELRG